MQTSAKTWSFSSSILRPRTSLTRFHSAAEFFRKLRVPKNQKSHKAGIRHKHVVVQQRGAKEHRRCQSVEQADQNGVGSGDAKDLETHAEKGSGTSRYGSHHTGNRDEGDQQEVELEPFANSAPEELAIVVAGDGRRRLLKVPGFNVGGKRAENKQRDCAGDGGARVVVDERATASAGKDVVCIAEEALDIERAGFGKGDGGKMLANDVGRPENRVGNPAREEDPPRCSHGGIIPRGRMIGG